MSHYVLPSNIVSIICAVKLFQTGFYFFKFHSKMGSELEIQSNFSKLRGEACATMQIFFMTRGNRSYMLPIFDNFIDVRPEVKELDATTDKLLL